MLAKLSELDLFCKEYGMRINEGKIKVFVISGKEGDSDPFVVDGLVVEYCSQNT